MAKGFVYVSKYRPFWFGFGALLTRELGQGVEWEYVDVPERHRTTSMREGETRALRTSKPLSKECIEQWELTEAHGE